MKKLLIAILSTVSLFCFMSCDGNKTPETPNEKPPVTSPGTEETYTITYDLGTRKNDTTVTIPSATQSVTYGENVLLYTPTYDRDKYEFLGWERQDTKTMYEGGVYTIKSNITLVAKWAYITENV